MDIFNDSIYFTVSTAYDLKENYAITQTCIAKILDFFETITDIDLMFTFDDDRSHKAKKVTEKSRQEVLDKLAFGNIYSFGVMEYMKRQDYFWGFDAITKFPSLACSIELNNPNRWRSITDTFDGIDVSVPTELFVSEEYFEKFHNLFKEIHSLLNGVNSFITRGTYESTLRIMNGAPFIHTYCTMNEKWDEYACGYFWGNVLSQKHIEKLGGFKEIKKQDFYKIEKWNDGVYIQVTKDILDYTLEEAKKIREFLLPLFPPKEDKRRPIYYSIDDLRTAQMFGRENFMIEEDML